MLAQLHSRLLSTDGYFQSLHISRGQHWLGIRYIGKKRSDFNSPDVENRKEWQYHLEITLSGGVGISQQSSGILVIFIGGNQSLAKAIYKASWLDRNKTPSYSYSNSPLLWKEASSSHSSNSYHHECPWNYHDPIPSSTLLSVKFPVVESHSSNPLMAGLYLHCRLSAFLSEYKNPPTPEYFMSCEFEINSTSCK